MNGFYTYEESLILNEITIYCAEECCSRENCPEYECVLWRIEQIITEDR